MTAEERPPEGADARAIDAFAEAVYELMRVRASSLGALDIDVDVDGWHVDGEVLFSSGPDMGFSVDALAGVAVFCELLGDDGERWFDEQVEGIDVLGARGEEAALEAHALAVLDGLLAARRPLLKR